MPRRKTLRATTRRAAPKAPPGKVGEDLTGESKEAKLEVLLKDFDDEVNMRLKEMSSSYDQLLKDIEKLYQFEIMKLPKAIQTMKFNDFIASGGSVNNLQFESQHREVDDLINSIKDRPVRKGRAAPRQMDTICEDGNVLGPAKTRNRAPKTNSRTAALRKKAVPTFETPMNSRDHPSTWETPLQTPAFDPRLPQTPAVQATGRKIKPGESLFLISANGSPIQLDQTPFVFAHNLKNNRVESICVLSQDDSKRLDKSILQSLPKANIA